MANFWDAAKAVVRGKFTSLQAHLKTQEKSQVNNLTVQLKDLEKEQKQIKVSRRKKIIKIRVELNEIQNKETAQKINTTKSWFFEKINKIDNPLARLTKEKREKTHINKIRNEREVTRHHRDRKDHTGVTMEDYMPPNSIPRTHG